MNSIINENAPKKDHKQIHYINFNQDYSCISIGTNEGYLIYNIEPLKIICEKSNLNKIIYIYRTWWWHRNSRNAL